MLRHPLVRRWHRRADALPQSAASASLGDNLPVHAGMPIATAERLLIEATLTKVGGNKKDAAQALGIGLKTLSYTRLQVYRATNEP